VDEELVAHGVPVRVVHFLEVVDVEHEARAGPARAQGHAQQPVPLGHEVAAVAHAGQLVRAGGGLDGLHMLQHRGGHAVEGAHELLEFDGRIARLAEVDDVAVFAVLDSVRSLHQQPQGVEDGARDGVAQHGGSHHHEADAEEEQPPQGKRRAFYVAGDPVQGKGQYGQQKQQHAVQAQQAQHSQPLQTQAGEVVAEVQMSRFLVELKITNASF